MSDSSPSRRDTIDLMIVQVLSTGLTLPILSMFSFRLVPPGLRLRIEPMVAVPASLGFPLPEDAIMPAARQAAGLNLLAGIALVLTVLMLVVGCATLVSLVQRAGVSRREELGIRAAVGATRGELSSLVVGPLFRRLAFGGAVGTALGLFLLWIMRAVVPESLILPRAPLSAVTPVSIFAPPLAAWFGARLNLREVLRRFTSPLTLESTTRLNPLAIGGAYFGLLVAVLATVSVLAGSDSYAKVVPTEWAEVRDTLLFEIENAGEEASLSALDAVRTADPDGEWHLVSTGALEGLGPATRELAECECPMGVIYSPYTRMWGQRHSVSPGAFAALGIPIIQGREFSAEDGPQSEGVVILDEDQLRRFPGVSPVGKRILVSGRGFVGTWYTIIGVADVPKPLDLATASQPIPGIYFSTLQHPPSTGQLVAPGAAERDAASIAATVDVSLVPQGSLFDRLAMWAEPYVWFMILTALVSIGAFVVGVYGVTTLTWLNVRARTSEFGVRRALGARPRHIRFLVLREVLEVAVVGAALGSIFGRGLTVGLAYRFRAVHGADLATLFTVAAGLGIAALLAAHRPARRAAAITPIEAIGDVH